jgi:large subunit ribosomal protein L25
VPEIPLTAQLGRSTGSRPSRRLRSTGRIPAVVYGRGIESTALSIDARELRAALSGEAGVNALLALEVDGTTHLTMAKEIQRHPVRGTVSHVDLVVIRRDEEVVAEVPVVLLGEATEVHKAGGVVDQQVFNLAIRSLPADIPHAIEIDVSELEIGSSIHLSDLDLPAGVSTDADPELTLVVGEAPRVVQEEEAATEAGEEPEEGPEAGAEQDEAAGEESGSSED